MQSKPSIYAYLNYRSYLKDMWEHLKATHGYSNRSFAQECKIKSPTHLFLVMSGQRNLTPSLLKKVIKAFGLRSRESEFLKYLVAFDSATTAPEKESVYRKIISFRRFAASRQLSEETLAYYSRWEHVAMLEALGTSLSELKPEALGEMIGLTAAETTKVIETLQALELIEWSGKRWLRTQSSFETPQETRSVLVRAFHREMIRKALAGVDELNPSERKLFSVTLPLDTENFEKLAEKIFSAMTEIASEFANPATPTGIFQLNLQLFPLFKAKDQPGQPPDSR